MGKLKIFLVGTYVYLRRFFFGVILGRNAYIQKMINMPSQGSDIFDKVDLKDIIFFLVSLKIRTYNRQEILKASLSQCLSQLPPAGKINFRINDSTEDEYFFSNEVFFKNLPAVSPLIQRTQTRLPGAYYQFLSQQAEPYCLTLFDDFPIVGLTEKVLRGSCALLKDFEKLVNVVLIEAIDDYDIDHEAKAVNFKKQLELERRNIKPLGIVEYFGQKFAIWENFHFGFFFSTSIVPTKDHAKRLKWYLDNISSDNPHKIELAGHKRRGPVYDYIAVPLGVYRFDLDFEHTEISIRPPVKKAEELYKAIKYGYKFISS